MALKDKPYALLVIGVVLAVVVLGGVWIYAGRGKTIPQAESGPTLTPEQETMRQTQGESHLGKDQNPASRDVGDTGGR
jgi:hypothetical protein